MVQTHASGPLVSAASVFACDARASLFCTIRSKFLRSTAMVTFPMAGTYMDAFSFTSGLKFSSSLVDQ